MNKKSPTVAFMVVQDFARAVEEKLAWTEAMGQAGGRRLTAWVGAAEPRRLPPPVGPGDKREEPNETPVVAQEPVEGQRCNTFIARSCERGLHDVLMALYRNVTSEVEEVRLGWAYLDLSGVGVLQEKSSHRATSELLEEVRRTLGLAVSAGLARNKTLARLAAHHAAPGTVFELRPENESRFLDAEPIENLPGLPFRHAVLLRDYGVSCIGDLGRIPEAAVNGLLGPRACQLSKWARGEDSRPVRRTDRADSEESAGVTFPRATLDYAIILEAAQRLTDGLLFELRKQRRLIRTVSVRTRHSDSRERHAHRRFQQPTAVYPEIHRAVTDLLSRVLIRRVRITGIDVGLGGFVLDPGQQILFPDRRERLIDLCRSVDRVWAKHGRVVLFGDAPSLRK